MKINWKVRINNMTFWVAFIPAILLLAQQVCGLFGFNISVEGLSDQLITLIGTLFSVLTLLGVVTDPTTSGVSDSTQAMTYNKPKTE